MNERISNLNMDLLPPVAIGGFILAFIIIAIVVTLRLSEEKE